MDGPQEPALDEDAPERRRWSLRLYVSGMTPSSARAVRAVKRLCERHLRGGYDLEVCDLYRPGARAECGEPGGVLATPQLQRLRPLPELRVVGDFEATERVLHELGISREGAT